MIATATETARPRKRRTVKTATAPAKVKLTLYVSPETAQRLAVHATMTGTDRSALVDDLIRASCRRFVVQDRGRDVAGAGDLDDRPDATDGASPSA